MEETTIEKYKSNREVNCRGCWKQGTCTVEYTYEVRSGVRKLVSAAVIQIPDGWETRNYGEAGGKAHYCEEC